MDISSDDLVQALQALAPTQLEVIDESDQHAGHAGADGSGRGTHFRIRLASPRFEGLNRVSKHRLVYSALNPLIARGVHAIAIETL